MVWFIVSLLNCFAPCIDRIEDLLTTDTKQRWVGEIKIVGNIETDDSDIIDAILLSSATPIKNWRVNISEWSLLLQHGEKFDFKRGKKPQVAFEPEEQGSNYQNLRVDFPEKRTGLRQKEAEIDEQCQRLAIQYLKAVRARDLTEVRKLVTVPWLGEEEKIIRTMPALTTMLKQKVVSHDQDQTIDDKASVMTYRRSHIQSQESRQLLDEVVTKDGRICIVPKATPPHSLRYVLVRLENGRPKVVGGDYPITYLVWDNQIPKAVSSALEKADQLELLSLEPAWRKEVPNGSFHGWQVLGKTKIQDSKERDSLITQFKRAISESDGFAAACFNPRHGIRVTFDHKKIDFVICYECYRIEIFEDAKLIAKVLTTSSAQPFLDSILNKAGVPLAPKSSK
jgi:hypothetical protein